ncbi:MULTISPECIES: class I SAM-dependent DNA methyltransferase [Bacillus]|uniref:Methyltransferase n=2 Tax=Bacillus TaxID=1386 RepID=A0A0M3R9M4_9BACI|nr:MULTISPECIES: class I SAM-dependent methyltransferase [Bacillus]ALC81692.1 methyltransferase [Bacillus gobiensis]MBP1080745.1 ubiquinone/menaquinone biosynthesis C-methylase UbiE [Bacillus capparidis]MED1094600.1 class I SAM-dependent methyltransferase [Bacillus capparidis]
MIYRDFASVYDELMSHAPYDEWLKWIDESIKAAGKEKGSVLDLACGTGELTLRLAKNGFEVTGIDISEEMLSVAIQKALAEKLSIDFYNQDMRDIAGHENRFDAVVICCDSLNYLTEEEDVLRTFQEVYHTLSSSGLLLFDVHSNYKMNELFPGHTYADDDDEISVIWKSFMGDAENSVFHDMTFFVNQGDNTYVRYDETHLQKTLPINRYIQYLEKSGFTLQSLTADFTDKSPTDTSERLFFVAKKE